MALCSCMSTRVAVAWRLSPERTAIRRRPGQHKQSSIVCGSKSSRKRSKDTVDTEQALETKEGRVSDASTGAPSKSAQELSRSGKPIGWKVLPREDSQQSPIQEEVSHEACFSPAYQGDACKSSQTFGMHCPGRMTGPLV